MDTTELWASNLAISDSKVLKNKLSAYKMLIHTPKFKENADLLDQAHEIIIRIETELLHRKEIFLDDGITTKKLSDKFIKMSK